MSVATHEPVRKPPARKPAAAAARHAAIRAAAKPAITWDEAASREEEQRRKFRQMMRLALIDQPVPQAAADVKIHKVLNAVLGWCNSNPARVTHCLIVLRGRHIDVLVFEKLQPYDEEFGKRLSELGITLAGLGIYANVRSVGLEEGETPDDAGDYCDDPRAVLELAS